MTAHNRPADAAPRDEQIASVRAFNRYYTRVLGLLEGTLLDSPATLVEARILWELRTTPACRAEDLIARLDMDRGYLSRLLASLEKRGLIVRRPSPEDARMKLLRLTPRGARLQNELDARASAQITELIGPLDAADRARLVGAMESVQALLDRARAGHER